MQVGCVGLTSMLAGLGISAWDETSRWARTEWGQDRTWPPAALEAIRQNQLGQALSYTVPSWFVH